MLWEMINLFTKIECTGAGFVLIFYLVDNLSWTTFLYSLALFIEEKENKKEK